MATLNLGSPAIPACSHWILRQFGQRNLTINKKFPRSNTRPSRSVGRHGALCPSGKTRPRRVPAQFPDQSIAHNSTQTIRQPIFSLAPSDGERVGVRGKTAPANPTRPIQPKSSIPPILAILYLLSSIFAFLRFLIPLRAKSYFLNRSVTLFLAALMSPFFKSFNALPAKASAADWTI